MSGFLWKSPEQDARAKAGALLDAAQITEARLRALYTEFILKRWNILPLNPDDDKDVLLKAYKDNPPLIPSHPHPAPFRLPFGSPDWNQYYERILEEAGNKCTRDFYRTAVQDFQQEDPEQLSNPMKLNFLAQNADVLTEGFTQSQFTEEAFRYDEEGNPVNVMRNETGAPTPVGERSASCAPALQAKAKGKTQKRRMNALRPYMGDAITLINKLLSYAKINEAIDNARKKGVQLSPDSIDYLSSLGPIEDKRYALRSLFINHILIRWGFIEPLPYQEALINEWTNRMEWGAFLSNVGDKRKIPDPGTPLWTIYTNIIMQQAQSACTAEYYMSSLPHSIQYMNDKISGIKQFEDSQEPSVKHNLMESIGTPGYTNYMGIKLSPFAAINLHGETYEYVSHIYALGQMAGIAEMLVTGIFNHFIDNFVVIDGKITNVIDPNRQPVCSRELATHRLRAVNVKKYGPGDPESMAGYAQNMAYSFKQNEDKRMREERESQRLANARGVFGPNSPKTKRRNFGTLKKGFNRNNLRGYIPPPPVRPRHAPPPPLPPRNRTAFSEKNSTSKTLQQLTGHLTRILGPLNEEPEEATLPAFNTTRNITRGKGARKGGRRKGRITRKRTRSN